MLTLIFCSLQEQYSMEILDIVWGGAIAYTLNLSRAHIEGSTWLGRTSYSQILFLKRNRRRQKLSIFIKNSM